MGNRLHTVIGWILGLGALTFVLLLGGLFSGALTEDPPAVSPYASSADSSSDDGLGALEDNAPSYLPGGDDDEDPTTTTTAAAPTTSAAPSATAALTISGFSFGDPITVSVGTEVTVTNEDGASHTWTSTEGVWSSGNLRGGDSFSFTFADPGEYAFVCNIHSSMTGTIVVTP